MRSKILLLTGCILLAACAAAPLEDLKQTGISRARAISIAKSNCPEYPASFNFVDKAEWVAGKSWWAVKLDDRSGDHGRVYRINRDGVIVSTRNISDWRDNAD